MNIRIFELLNEDCSEFDACLVVFRESQRRMEEIKKSYESRVVSQRRYAEDRKKTLEAILMDASRTETARKMAQKELDSLKDCTYSPTDAEKEEYAEEKETARAAISDLRKASDALRISIAGAESEIAKAKSATLNNQTFDLVWMQKQLDNDSGLA